MSKVRYSPIILGTVQFGMPYGIGALANRRMDEGEVDAILSEAVSSGVTTLDTSPDYGLSHRRVKDYIKKYPKTGFHIITKVKAIPENEDVYEYLQNFIKSLWFSQNDACKSLTLLLHKEGDIMRKDVVSSLDKLTGQGFIDCWGVSVYEVDAAIIASQTPGCAVVQLPFSLFNQKFKQLGVVERLKAANKLILARSIFVQGLIFSEKINVERQYSEVAKVIEVVKAQAEASNMSLSRYMIQTIFHLDVCDSVVVGVDSLTQLSELFGNHNERYLMLDNKAIQSSGFIDCRLFQPQLW